MAIELQPDGEDAVICEFCGLPIEEEEQVCAALEDGRCRP
jgi:predicted nucleic acid-binding Zn ribbon protein